MTDSPFTDLRFISRAGKWSQVIPDLEGDHVPNERFLLEVNPGILLEEMFARGKAKLKDLEVAI